MGSLLALQGPALLAEALCTCVAAGCWRFHSSFPSLHSWVAEGFISPGVFIPLVLRGHIAPREMGSVLRASPSHRQSCTWLLALYSFIVALLLLLCSLSNVSCQWNSLTGVALKRL